MKNLLLLLVFIPVFIYSQQVPGTVIDLKLMQSLINEASGALQLKNLYDVSAYEADRKSGEYSGQFHETKFIVEKAQEYGFKDVKVEKWKASSKIWDGEVGELWLSEPEKKLLISYRDETMTLAPNSTPGEYEGELVYVGKGNSPNDYKNIDVENKIVLGEAGLGELYYNAVRKYKAKGVLSFSTHHFFENPDKILSQSLPYIDKETLADSLKHYLSFGFSLSPRIGKELADAYYKTRNSRNSEKGSKIILKAIVKAQYRDYEEQLVSAIIPGDGSSNEEICLSAHLFEGYQKQGSNDDLSGCVTLLETGRIINKLIDEGKISKPAKTIRFLWVPEISGSFWYLVQHRDIAKNIVMNINLDMVGEDTYKNLNTIVFYQNPGSRIHWSDDATIDLFEWMGKTSSERLETRGYSYGYQIFDILGSRHPFLYSIEPWSSGSDHIVFQMQYFKIPSIFFNNWPDVNYHTSFDRPAFADATELKRIGVITTALSLLGSVTPEIDFYNVSDIIYSKIQQRLGAGLGKEINEISNSPAEKIKERFRDSKYIIKANFERELIRIETLLSFAVKENQKKIYSKYLEVFKSNLYDIEKIQINTLQEAYRNICERKRIKYELPAVSEIEKEMGEYIPKDMPVENIDPKDLWKAIGGGFSWTSDISPRYISELKNFIDGKRTILQIRNLVSAEFEPVPLEPVFNFFKQLEKDKYLKLIKK
jgi:aminopeptidase YwaD